VKTEQIFKPSLAETAAMKALQDSLEYTA